MAVDGALVEAERARIDGLFLETLTGHCAWTEADGVVSETFPIAWQSGMVPSRCFDALSLAAPVYTSARSALAAA
ncbi:hypothetical protein E4V01_25360 [Methylorubrum sp. Q1]|nr:hypothetical protein E4V01_25360 [Methylorubrum sp. Q1]